LPAEITQANSRVAEVKFICDRCKILIGTRLMPKTQAEEMTENKTICQRCKKELFPDR
jgi:ribosomal protein L40E